MIVSDHPKFVFIHVHRTAGTSISTILTPQAWRAPEEYHGHENVRSLPENFKEAHPDHFIFGFTRNPWDRILSWYALLHPEGEQRIEDEKLRFQEFLTEDKTAIAADPYFHYNSLNYFTDKNGRMVADMIYRYEDLDKDYHEITERLNLKPIPLPILNNTTKKDYRAYYTDTSKEIIARKCQKDIEYFGYRF